MPRVVADQKSKFENDELFRKLSRESEIRYTAYRDRPLEERQIRFINGCREGHADVAFVSTGTNLQLIFNSCINHHYNGTDYCDFDKEKGKVHLRSSMIIDGVCIRWRGWIDLERLDGIGCLEYDEDRGRIEDAILREQIEQYKMRMREFEERQRLYKLAQAEHQKKTSTVTSAMVGGNLSKSELRKHHIENILSGGGGGGGPGGIGNEQRTDGSIKKH